MNTRFERFGALLLSIFVAACASSATQTVDPNVNKDASGLALAGYDPVAYFDGAAREGSAAHESEYRGATYRFASERDQELFERDPEAYLPEFGGYCAFGVAAKGAKVPTTPETFRVQDGRLLLFLNGPFDGQHVDTSKLWDDDPGAMLSKADDNWPALQDKQP